MTDTETKIVWLPKSMRLVSIIMAIAIVLQVAFLVNNPSSTFDWVLIGAQCLMFLSILPSRIRADAAGLHYAALHVAWDNVAAVNPRGWVEFKDPVKTKRRFFASTVNRVKAGGNDWEQKKLGEAIQTFKPDVDRSL